MKTVRCGLFGDSYRITIIPGVWTILVMSKKLWNGMLTGRHFASGLSFRESRTRCRNSASAHG